MPSRSAAVSGTLRMTGRWSPRLALGVAARSSTLAPSTIASRILQPYTPPVGILPEFRPDVQGFQWDEGNASKNWTRHKISQTEAEQVFLNRPLVVVAAPLKNESRQFAFGHTDKDRLLTVAFTVRETLVRVISVRPMSRRERRGYGQTSNS